jgi:hypothetical protein
MPEHDYRPLGEGVYRCADCGRTITLTVVPFGRVTR